MRQGINAVAAVPEFFTSPAGLATIPAVAVAPTAVAAFFTLDMAKALGNQGLELWNKWDEMTPEQRAASLTDMGATGAMMLGAGAHLKNRVRSIADTVNPQESPPVIPRTGAEITPPQGARAPRTEPAPIERVTPEQAAAQAEAMTRVADTGMDAVANKPAPVVEPPKVEAASEAPKAAGLLEPTKELLKQARAAGLPVEAQPNVIRTAKALPSGDQTQRVAEALQYHAKTAGGWEADSLRAMEQSIARAMPGSELIGRLEATRKQLVPAAAEPGAPVAGKAPATAPVVTAATVPPAQVEAKLGPGMIPLTVPTSQVEAKPTATEAKAAPATATPGPGAMTPGEPPRAQIEQLTTAFKGIEASKPTLRERVQEAFRLGERSALVKDSFSKALSGLNRAGDYLTQRWKGIENIDDLLRSKGELSAELEKRGWRTRAWVKQANKSIPRARDQAAIAKWIDAGGDAAELRRGAAETKPQYRQAYEDALNLKGDLLVAAENARNYFDSRLQEAIDAGVVKAGVEDYIHRIYESRPDLQQKAYAYVQSSLLKANPALARKRVFQFDWEAEKLGYRPVQSFVQRIAQYESSLSKAIAAREFIRKASEMKAADGRPVIDIKGVGTPITDVVTGERQATLIKPTFNPQKANEPGTENYRGDYVNKEFPALSRWKWVSADSEGKPIFVQGDVAIHPDYVHRISSLLEPSRIRYGKYGRILRPALNVGATFKQTMLDLSMFHQVQIAVHGMEHKVAPWKIIKDIDFENPNVDGLLRGGITLGGEYYPTHAAEGLIGSSLSRQIPFLGPLMQSYHSWLFQDYIPRIKMTMALKALERNRARYGDKMSDEAIMNKTAGQANAAFGELNYTMLERSKTAQDISRLIMLAPDFLEARGRFAAEALAKGGKSAVPGFGNEQRAALLLGALTMYVTARIANKVINDQYHFEPENAFSIVYNGHAYGLRTVQGDILHLLEKPLQFWLNRLNPVYGRTLLQLVTGRDYFGRKRTVPETLWDSASNITPIALRSGRERKLWESIANSMGITVKRWNDVDDAFTLAKKWKDEHGIGEKGEFIYDPDKDQLRGLKVALSYGDDAGAVKEIRKLVDSGYQLSKLNDYFKRYAGMPFTGSFKNDKEWQQTLSEDEKKTVEGARQHKQNIRDLYTKSVRQYLAAQRTPTAQ